MGGEILLEVAQVSSGWTPLPSGSGERALPSGGIGIPLFCSQR